MKTLIAAILTMAATCSLHADSSDYTEYKLVLWNQHNGTFNDRGTKTCKIEALKDGIVVWQQEHLQIPWAPNKDTKAALVIPPQLHGIDEIKISVTQWTGFSGGLSEIQLFNGDSNITKTCKVTVSASYDNRFVADKLIDGITTSAATFSGYWLLPDNTPGFADLKLPN